MHLQQTEKAKGVHSQINLPEQVSVKEEHSKHKKNIIINTPLYM